MRLRFPLFLFLVSIIIASCSKDSIIIKQLDGTWKMRSTTDPSLDLSAGTIEYTFTKCKNSQEPCDGYTKVTVVVFGFPLSSVADFTWEVNDQVVAVIDTANVHYDYDFLEREDSYMKVEGVGTGYQYEFDKE